MNDIMSTAYKTRLKNDYDAIQRLPRNNGLFEVKPSPGQKAPYVESYRVTFTVPTWVKDGTQLKSQTRTVVEITRKSLQDKPRAVVVEGRVPYHPNWFPSGTVCNGHAWRKDMWMYEYIGFVCELLQFKASRIDTGSPANPSANEFWKEHRNERKLFPTDERTIPVPREVFTIDVVSVTKRS